MKRLRKKYGLTQEQLGILTDTSQSYISRIEHGKIDSVTIHKLEIISKIFEIKPWELLKILEKNRTI